MTLPILKFAVAFSLKVAPPVPIRINRPAPMLKPVFSCSVPPLMLIVPDEAPRFVSAVTITPPALIVSRELLFAPERVIHEVALF